MKGYIILTGLCLLVGLSKCYSQSGGGTLEVTITKLRNSKGQVLVSLFNQASGFPEDPQKAFRVTRIPLAGKSASAKFENLPSGTYAIAILHDENNDRVMNKNFLGIPREGYGFSNNAMGVFSPPTFLKAGFSLLQGQKLAISIYTRY